MAEREQIEAELNQLSSSFAELSYEISHYEAQAGDKPPDIVERLRLRRAELAQNTHSRERGEKRLAQILEAEAEEHRHTERARRTAESEEATFWFRRFHTSLAIAHGGAFVSIASKLFDKDTGPAAIAAAWAPMAAFGLGMLIAGTLPIALYRRNGRLGWWLAGASAGVFTVGLLLALAAAWRLGHLVWPWQL